MGFARQFVATSSCTAKSIATSATHGVNTSGSAGLLRDPGLRGERGTTRPSGVDEYRLESIAFAGERSQALRVPALHRRMLLFTVFAANLLFAQVLKHAFDIVFAFDEAIVATVLAGVRNV